MFLKRMKKQASRERSLMLRDGGLSFTFVSLMLLDGWFLVRAFAARPPTLGLSLWLTAGFLGWLLADLASGVVHYVADNFGSADTPILGRMVIAPFREHHAAPLDLLKHDFLERNANNALIALPLLGWIPFADLNSSWTLFLACASLQMALWAAVTNEIHAAAHSARMPAWVRQLQRCGLILSPDHHRAHHSVDALSRENTQFHYCITSGACDRIASALRAATKTRNTS